MDPSSTGTMQRIQSEKSILDEPDSPLEIEQDCETLLWKYSDRTMKGQALLFISLLCIGSVLGQVSYTIPEEMTKGSLVGNIAQDLGLENKRLVAGKARIYSRDNDAYIELNRERGVLLVKERIDREALCRQTTPCALHFQIILENPMEFYSVTVQITDINDNAPTFEEGEITFKINADSGVIHAVRSFDYEQIKDFQFHVKAQDGGSPPLSSNSRLEALWWSEMVPRSADVGYLVTKVVAVDVDSGQNAWLSYKLQKATDRALFEVGSQNGEIRTIRQVTDKDAVKQRLTVIVEDNGQPSRSATVIVNVAVADSFPEVLSEFTDFTHDKEYNDNLTFYLVLALAVVSFLFITCLVVIISVKIYRWRQSRILYHSNLPVIPYYPPRYSDTLGTGTLQHVYNYEVCRTTDSRKSDCKFGRACSQNVLIMDPSSTGTMQRIQSEKSILDEPDSPLEISDVNDNAPVFERSSYEAYIVENNTPGLSIFTVKARDADWNQNARVSYILEDSSVNGVPVSSYVSVSADSGVIHAVRSFDYEQIKDFQFHVKAQDGGSPPLSSNVTVKIMIQDQNDNPPQVLYPVQTGGSLVAEMVPRSADVGYLVTKVVAVDVGLWTECLALL
ncbi:hypothetical protein L3Q82_005746 [Scortum barcoo]|uniref:Uncharacterized protein n=1 Tax=Scortum barcoo TaxID=214431 RepID=A0ACB8V6P2_9TELE|nr:hypothetical protein L3Q82_005746 [Scortum barcoo]